MGLSQFSRQIFHNVQQQADDGARALILDAGEIDLLNLIEQGTDARLGASSQDSDSPGLVDGALCAFYG
jgi:hypothetical protein